MGDRMSTINVDTINNAAGTDLPTNLKPVTATAWVNFNGTGTVTIRDQYNIASITDIGTGEYELVFNSVLDNTSYVVSMMPYTDRVSTNSGPWITGINGTAGVPTTKTTSQVRLGTTTLSGGGTDAQELGAIIFGGQS